MKMMLSQQFRWLITYRLVAQLCRSCELQANTITATLKSKYGLYVKHTIIILILTDGSAIANLLNQKLSTTQT